MKTDEKIWLAFEYGVDYGQLLMEEERLTDECIYACGSVNFAKKHCVPAQLLQTRQIHSDKWFKIKRASKKKFFELLKNL